MNLARVIVAGVILAMIGCSSGGGGGPLADGPGGDDGGASGDSSTGGGDPDAGAPGDDSGGGGGGGGGGSGGSGGGGGGGGGGSGGDAGGGSTCPGIDYCDGFESYSGGAIQDGETLGPWTASVSPTGATMAIDTTMAFKGTHSLHITGADGTGHGTHGTLRQGVAAGLVAGNDLYGRAMVYYSNAGDAGLPDVHSLIFSAGGTSAELDAGSSMNLGDHGPAMQINYSPTDNTVNTPGGSISMGSWHCVQWQYDGSGSPPEDVANVWLDGTLAVNVPASHGWKFATPFDSMSFGLTWFQVITSSVDVYLDEFAVSHAMVPCP